MSGATGPLVIEQVPIDPVVRTRWLPIPTPTSLDDRIPPLWRWRLSLGIYAILSFALLFYNFPQLIADVVYGPLADPSFWLYVALRAALCVLGAYLVWEALRIASFRVPKGLEGSHGVPEKGRPTTFVASARSKPQSKDL